MSNLSDPFEAFKPVISWRLVDELKPNPRNARTHRPKQIQQIAASIREFGFTAPVLIDSSGIILAGNGRAEAANKHGMERVTTIMIDHLNDAH